jgi:DNA-binding NtrC family response regulator
MAIKTAGVSVPSPDALNSMPVGLPLKLADEIVLDLETSWILVVDDDLNVLHLVANMVLRLGHRPVTAASAMEALWKLDQAHFDLAITDFAMSFMNGCRLAEEIKRKQAWVRVIVMTGQCAEVVEAQLIDASAVDRILLKPFNLMTMKEAIALAHHPYLRESGRTRSRS